MYTYHSQTSTKSPEDLFANYEGGDLVSLTTDEMSEVDGGFLAFLVGVAIGVTVAHYIATH
ncbi:hypothetical protein FEM33_14125 [Dyadobacter flavalbus]|uniref:Class IIb bacteriocin, lactobin A/cerein 7B family n=1 Tax=Dyadobacter flavalbus TaxID=2579942 RepID=A0A5M8QY99_9BACT|nr:hypothetical protein [Dyadobacter flavalbus]KAA6439393.1 hypothetical protein FEM33_14125 [Dyadobacter flavalbus]